LFFNVAAVVVTAAVVVVFVVVVVAVAAAAFVVVVVVVVVFGFTANQRFGRHYFLQGVCFKKFQIGFRNFFKKSNPIFGSKKKMCKASRSETKKLVDDWVFPLLVFCFLSRRKKTFCLILV
jgi:hypothetical protein